MPYLPAPGHQNLTKLHTQLKSLQKTLTNYEVATKGLRDSRSSLAAIGTVLKTALMNPYDLDSRRRYYSHWRNGIQSHGIWPGNKCHIKNPSLFCLRIKMNYPLNSQLDATASRISELKALKAQGNLSPSGILWIGGPQSTKFRVRTTEFNWRNVLPLNCLMPLSKTQSVPSGKKTQQTLLPMIIPKKYMTILEQLTMFMIKRTSSRHWSRNQKLDELKGRKSELISEIDNPHTSSLKSQHWKKNLKTLRQK